MLAALALFINAEACPGSGAWFGHAKAAFTVKFTNSCTEVRNEIMARGQMQNGWKDPHNGGKYSVTSSSDSKVSVQRVTGGSGTYTDKMDFQFQDDSGGCQVAACSESQVTSLYDSGTNYCNLWDLFCNASDCNSSTGICCKPINTSLAYQITTGPTCNTSSNCPSDNGASKCLLMANLQTQHVLSALTKEE